MVSICNCRTVEAAGRRTAQMRFLREELLYDIKNYAYIEADVLGEENQHAHHTLSDIGEAGNIDRVNRVLALDFATVVELLYPRVTKVEISYLRTNGGGLLRLLNGGRIVLASGEYSGVEVIDDKLYTPDTYMLELTMPDPPTKSNTLHLLSRLIHEHMVCKVLSDWMKIMHPKGAEMWEQRVDKAETEITRWKLLREGPIERRISVI